MHNVIKITNYTFPENRHLNASLSELIATRAESQAVRKNTVSKPSHLTDVSVIVVDSVGGENMYFLQVKLKFRRKYI